MKRKLTDSSTTYLFVTHLPEWLRKWCWRRSVTCLQQEYYLLKNNLERFIWGKFNLLFKELRFPPPLFFSYGAQVFSIHIIRIVLSMQSIFLQVSHNILAWHNLFKNISNYFNLRRADLNRSCHINILWGVVKKKKRAVRSNLRVLNYITCGDF